MNERICNRSNSTNRPLAQISSSPALGWQWVYYVLALVSPLFLGLWLLLYTDHPNTHKCVNERERAQIHRGKSAAEIEIDGYMPYRCIFWQKGREETHWPFPGRSWATK